MKKTVRYYGWFQKAFVLILRGGHLISDDPAQAVDINKISECKSII